MSYVRGAAGTWHVFKLLHGGGSKAITACDRIVKIDRVTSDPRDVKWVRPVSNVCTECEWPAEVREHWASGAIVNVSGERAERAAELVAEGVEPDVACRQAYYERLRLPGNPERAAELARSEVWQCG